MKLKTVKRTMMVILMLRKILRKKKSDGLSKATSSTSLAACSLSKNLSTSYNYYTLFSWNLGKMIWNSLWLLFNAPVLLDLSFAPRPEDDTAVMNILRFCDPDIKMTAVKKNRCKTKTVLLLVLKQLKTVKLIKSINSEIHTCIKLSVGYAARCRKI